MNNGKDTGKYLVGILVALVAGFILHAIMASNPPTTNNSAQLDSLKRIADSLAEQNTTLAFMLDSTAAAKYRVRIRTVTRPEYQTFYETEPVNDSLLLLVAQYQREVQRLREATGIEEMRIERNDTTDVYTLNVWCETVAARIGYNLKIDMPERTWIDTVTDIFAVLGGIITLGAGVYTTGVFK